MRKIIALLLVIILLPIVVLSEAGMTREEYYTEVNDSTIGILKSIVDAYNQAPEAFDADLIMMAYSYYAEYLALRRILTLESLWKYTGLTDGSVYKDLLNGTSLQQEHSYAYIDKIISEKFMDWSDGKKTDEEFAKYIIGVISGDALSKKSEQ